MEKLLVASVLLLTFVAPAIGARDPNPVRGFKRALAWAALFHLVYGFSLLLVYPRLAGP